MTPQTSLYYLNDVTRTQPMVNKWTKFPGLWLAECDPLFHLGRKLPDYTEVIMVTGTHNPSQHPRSHRRVEEILWFINNWMIKLSSSIDGINVSVKLVSIITTYLLWVWQWVSKSFTLQVCYKILAFKRKISVWGTFTLAPNCTALDFISLPYRQLWPTGTTFPRALYLIFQRLWWLPMTS